MGHEVWHGLVCMDGVENGFAYEQAAKSSVYFLCHRDSGHRQLDQSNKSFSKLPSFTERIQHQDKGLPTINPRVTYP